MSCSRTQEIDLLGFLEAPRRPEFDAFREHYPRCGACASEVGAWTELQLGLQAQGTSGSHPDPGLLLAYAEVPDGLAAPERNALAGHLERCVTCRDELRALGAWAPAIASSLPGWRRALASLARVTWSPAFAYALVGLLLFPVLYRAIGPASDDGVTEIDTLRTETARVRAARAGRAIPAEVLAPLAEGESADAPAPTVVGAEPTDRFRLSGASAPAEPQAEPVIPPAPALLADEAKGELREVEERFAAKTAAASRPLDELAPEPAAELDAAGEAGVAESTAPSAAERANVRDAHFVVRAVSEEERGAGGRADSALRAPAAPAPIVVLDAARAIRLEPRRAAAGLTLQLPLPEATVDGAASEVEIELAEASGPRTLRQRLRLDPGSAAVELDVPSLWMVPGHYRASVRDSRGLFAIDFRLEVTSR